MITFISKKSAEVAKFQLQGRRVQVCSTWRKGGAAGGDTKAPCRDLVVRWALREPTLMLQNLHPRVDSSMIRSSFSQFGTVASEGVDEHPVAKQLRLPMPRTGTGWVSFDRRGTAAEVLEICVENMLVMAGSPSPVTVTAVQCTSAHLLECSSPVPAPPGTHPVPARFAAAGTLDFELAAEQRELWHRQSVEVGLLLSHFRLEKQQLLETQAEALNAARSATVQLTAGSTTLTDMLIRARKSEAAAAQKQAERSAADDAKAQMQQAGAFKPSEDESALQQALQANEHGIGINMDELGPLMQGGSARFASMPTQSWVSGGASSDRGHSIGPSGTYDPRIDSARRYV